MKKDVKEVIRGEEPYLNNLLSQEDLSSFKGMVDELRDTWTKKQMFRTETESWNGSSWTETGDLNTARSYLGRGGANNTSALAFSGAPSAATEEFVTPTTSTVTFTAS